MIFPLLLACSIMLSSFSLSRILGKTVGKLSFTGRGGRLKASYGSYGAQIGDHHSILRQGCESYVGAATGWGEGWVGCKQGFPGLRQGFQSKSGRGTQSQEGSPVSTKVFFPIYLGFERASSPRKNLQRDPARRGTCFSLKTKVNSLHDKNMCVECPLFLCFCLLI